MKMKILLLLITCISLVGCAVGRKVDYAQSSLTLDYSNKKKLAVGAQDKRQYIVFEQKKENFVGLMRGGFGNPFDVTTSTNNAFADDVTSILIEAIRHSGGVAVPLSLAPNTSRADVIQKVKRSEAPNALILTIHEWKSDSTTSTNIYFDLEMEVLDQNGVVQAKNRIQGVEQISGSFWAADPFEHVEKNAPKILKSKIEELFAGDISKALLSRN